MASTTTVLGLLKPAYSDDSDIGDINGNMDIIDAEAAKVRGNVAADYDSAQIYAVGDLCLHDGNLEKCNTPISSPEAWNASHWTQIKIAGELTALNDKIVGNAITVTDFNNVITPGTYQARASGTATNAPNPSVPGRWYNLSVFVNAEGEITQLAYTTSYGLTYIRGRTSGGSWSSWQELALKSDLSTFVKSKTFSITTDATGCADINASNLGYTRNQCLILAVVTNIATGDTIYPIVGVYRASTTSWTIKFQQGNSVVASQTFNITVWYVLL